MQLVDSDREKGLKPVVWDKYRNIIEKYEKNVSFLPSPLKAKAIFKIDKVLAIICAFYEKQSCFFQAQ